MKEVRHRSLPTARFQNRPTERLGLGIRAKVALVGGGGLSWDRGQGDHMARGVYTYTCAKTHLTIYLRAVHFTVCQPYLSLKKRNTENGSWFCVPKVKPSLALGSPLTSSVTSGFPLPHQTLGCPSSLPQGLGTCRSSFLEHPSQSPSPQPSPSAQAIHWPHSDLCTVSPSREIGPV